MTSQASVPNTTGDQRPSPAASFTPGPWRFDHDWGRSPTIFADLQVIAHVEKHKRMTTNPGQQDDLPEREANARLIAAAPEMLKALEKALPFIVNDDSPGGCDGQETACAHCEAIRNIRAALAKATGAA